MADRVGVMNAGRLEQLDAPQVLYAAPRSAFVADFVGLMNRAPAEVVDGQVQVLGTTLPAVEGSVSHGRGVALIRPEQLQLVRTSTGSARVVAVSFQGPVSRAQVRTGEGTELVVLLSGSGAAGLAADAPVDVRVDAAGLLVASS